MQKADRIDGRTGRGPALATALGAVFMATAVAAAAEPGHTYSLFDGESLDGWTIENDCEVEVVDGVLLLKSGDGWLRSDHTYDDFVLHVEWKPLRAENYDAGVYLRTLPGGDPWPRRGYQANLRQGQEGRIGNLPGAESPSGLVRPGEWNAFDIAVVGDTVELKINGRRAYRVGGVTIPRGHVGIQVEVTQGGQFLVRNIRVTELGHRSLFNGRDLDGWEGADQPAEACWEVRDGVLACTRKTGPWLRTLEQFDDFNLRLEYQVEPGGNSGVYVRVPADGNHHREDASQPEAGFEVQILDDAAPQYAQLEDYQYSASVYGIAGADPRVSRPAGRWNTLEIDCRGSRVITFHNGVQVTEVTEQSHPAIGLRKRHGYLGLQNHGGGVNFRNLRIGPPRAE